MNAKGSTVEDYFLRPRNVGDLRERANACGEACSPTCGAVVRLSLEIDEASQQITRAQFKAAGCRFLIASASALTELIKGTHASAALALNEETIAAHLTDFPLEKLRCAALCCGALQASVAHYSAQAATATHDEWVGEEALICTCFGVAENSIEQTIHTHVATTVEEVTAACNAGGGCGSCHPLIEDMLEDYRRTETLQSGTLHREGE